MAVEIAKANDQNKRAGNKNGKYNKKRHKKIMAQKEQTFGGEWKESGRTEWMIEKK